MPHGTRHFADCPGEARCWCETRRYTYVLVIGVVILALEIVGGHIARSLALLADAGHVAIDNSAVVVAMLVSIAARMYPAHESRVRNIGFACAILLLVGIAAWVLVEAYERYKAPAPVKGLLVIGIASIGAMGNYIQHRVLLGAGDHRTHRVLHTHIRADLGMSIGVIVSGIVISVTGWYVIDPVISALIALWIVVQIAHLVCYPDARGPHTH